MKRIMLLVVAAAFMISCESRTYADISAPESSNPTYDANVKAIMEANCTTTGCHNQGETFPPLTNYTEVKEAAQNGALLCKINDQCGVMPETGKMPQTTVDVINLWEQQGFIEK